ncbi:TonB family protein [Tahibacter harae]|uniref:Energy transducer TonB n=1 Tax=Tahibacter harae TaxID=2963937 RepID=A0ABT1QPK6_9GAMM|nr:TonB family protein [Tahibacter harae]MCQ4164200.1 energy transducer TonB [Tahibacter harae]
MLPALLLTLATATVAAPADTSLPMLFARVRVSADGAIIAAEFRNPPAPELETELRRRMEDWRFEPVEGAHDELVTETTLSIALHLERQGVSLVPVVDAVHSGLEAVRTVMPDYTVNAGERGQAGGVLLRCRVRNDGSCGQVSVESAGAPDKLVRAARRALEDWRFLPELVAGRPSTGWILVPFCFAATPLQRELCSEEERGGVQTLDSPLQLIEDSIE